MSLPKFPDRENQPTRDEALNQIISSIAMEEVGLSHIINAEGEKIQYVLGTLQDVPPLQTPPTIDQLLAINQSVRDTLDTTVQNQMFLRGKLQSALNAATLVGPTGPTGPVGPPIDPETIILTVTDGTDTQQIKFQDTVTLNSDTLDIQIQQNTIKVENPRNGGSIIQYASPTIISPQSDPTGAPLKGYVLTTTGALSFEFTDPTTIMLDQQADIGTSMPLDGYITGISSYAVAAGGGIPQGKTNLHVAVFKSTVPNNVYTLVPQTDIILEVDQVTQMTTYHTAAAIDQKLNQNDRFLVATWATNDHSVESIIQVSLNASISIVLE